ncbi:hypothetical protein MXB_4692 [Myxobolus squamalis]|nr:hypothetical protein MXB_4692 [Myxobolus squamalis]
MFLISEGKDLKKQLSLMYQSLLTACLTNPAATQNKLTIENSKICRFPLLVKASILSGTMHMVSLVACTIGSLFDVDRKAYCFFRMNFCEFIDATLQVTSALFLQSMIVMEFDSTSNVYVPCTLALVPAKEE